MEKVKREPNVGFIGTRYFATRMCEKFCLIDTLPDDPEYRRKAAHGCVLYFQKIIDELPYCRDNALELTEKAKRLEAEWKEGNDYERHMKERRHTSSVMSAMCNKGRAREMTVNRFPYEAPPKMRNFPRKPYTHKKKNPEE